MQTLQAPTPFLDSKGEPMKLIELNPNVTRLRIFGALNVYLLRESDGFTVIDTSIGGQAKNIAKAAQKLGTPIKRILLTHAHGDHIGSLDALHTLLGNVDIAISEREAPLLHKDLSLRPGEPQQKPKGSLPGARSRPTHTLSEGELFGSLRCINTPGHTPGHMSFLDERDNTLFAGDALVGMGSRLSLVTAPPWWFPLPKVATWDKPTADRSAQKLLQYKPALICTGHGLPITNGTAALSEALRSR